MSSGEAPPAAARAQTGPAPDGAVAAGEMLRQAREAAGVNLASLAASLKVPVTRLQALEDGRIADLPDPVFARALAASICRSLRIDPQPVLERIPRTRAAPLLPDDAHAKAPFKPQPQPQRVARSPFARFPGPLGLAVLALIFATLVLIFLPQFGFKKPVGDAGEVATSAPEVQPGRVIDSTAPGATASAAPIASKPPSPPVAEGSGGPAAAAVVDSQAAASAPATTAQAPVDTVVFQTGSAAWIQVIDANGQALVRKTVPAGETFGVTGDLPLRVTVGRADITKVSVRGEPLDLAPLTKGTVARFEVK